MSSYKPISYINDTSNLERGYDDTPRSGHDHRERLTPRDLADELAKGMARRLDAAAQALGLSRKNYDPVELRGIIGSNEDSQFKGSARDLLEMETITAQAFESGGDVQVPDDSGFSDPSEAQAQRIETLDTYAADAGEVATETASFQTQVGQAEQLSEDVARDRVQKALQAAGYGGRTNV